MCILSMNEFLLYSVNAGARPESTCAVGSDIILRRDVATFFLRSPETKQRGKLNPICIQYHSPWAC